MKCDKCGYDDNGTGDAAHACLPANVVQPTAEDSVADTFSARVKLCRKRKGLTLKQVADAIGASSQQVIHNYENRNDGVSIDKLFLLADVLGVSARWLAIGVDDGLVSPLSLSSGMHPVVAQSTACLEAFLATGAVSLDLVHAALRLLRQGERA